jgi:hypothetical protein
MRAKEFITNFFEESEEEIREELKDARSTVRELNEKLKLMEEKRALFEKQKARLERKEKIRREKRNAFLKGLALAIIILLIASAITFALNKYFSNTCGELKSIKGNSVIGCIKTDEPHKTDLHKVSFFFKSNLNKESNCIVQSIVSINKIEISNKEFNAGTFQPGEIKKLSIDMLLPEGNSNFELQPYCK